MIVAKTVIPNQYWILREDDRKVGNIEAGPEGFQVRINDQVESFKTIHTIKKTTRIEFEAAVTRKPVTSTARSVYGYHTTSRPYNGVYDVKHQVPLWTREPRSRSWLAAGWYRVKQGRSWQIVECPKLIMLERYEYQGPYMTQKQALES
jgi:hypothetical protein